MKDKTKKNSEASDEKLKKAQQYLELAISLDQTIRDASKHLSQKIDKLLTIPFTLVTIISGLGYFILKEKFTTDFFIFIVLSLLCFFISILIGLWLQRPKDYRFMDSSVIFRKYKDKPLSFIINKSASTLIDATLHNGEVINSCGFWMRLMLVFVFIGLLFVSIAFVIFGMVV